MVAWLLDNFPDLVNIPNKNGNLAVHFAAAQGMKSSHICIIYYVIAKLASYILLCMVNMNVLVVCMCFQSLDGPLNRYVLLRCVETILVAVYGCQLLLYLIVRMCSCSQL